MEQRKKCFLFSYLTSFDKKLAIELAEKKFDIAYTSPLDVANGDLEEKISTAGGKSICCRFDQSDFKQIDIIVKDIIKQWNSIDLVVINTNDLVAKEFEKLSLKEIETGIDMHVNTLYYVTKSVLMGYVSRKRGTIIHLCSSLIYSTQSLPVALFAGLKCSTIGFTKALSKEVGRYGIKVNTVLSDKLVEDIPNVSEQLQKARTLSGSFNAVASLVELIAYLEHPNTPITGQVISVDGGITDHVL